MTVSEEESVHNDSTDLLAQKAKKYLNQAMKIPKHLDIKIKVIKKQGRYYVSEWRSGKHTFSGIPVESPIARLSRVPGKKELWQLAWMRANRKWYNLGKEYQGSFERCLELIVADPDHCFWG